MRQRERDKYIYRAYYAYTDATHVTPCRGCVYVFNHPHISLCWGCVYVYPYLCMSLCPYMSLYLFLLRRYISTFPTSLLFSSLQRRGEQLLMMGKTAKAISDYRTAVKLQPGSAAALNDLGVALYEVCNPKPTNPQTSNPKPLNSLNPDCD